MTSSTTSAYLPETALHALRAAVHGLNGETFEREVLSDEFAEFRVIVHHQNALCPGSLAVGFIRASRTFA